MKPEAANSVHRSRFAMLVWAGVLLLPSAVPCSGQNGAAAEYNRAEALVRNHQWDEGLEVLRPLLQAAPTSLKLLNLTGLAYTGKGDLAQADRYFQAALQADPAFVPALKNLGVNELSLGETRPAREHLESAARLTPEDPVVNLYLGEIAYRQQDFRSAVQHLRRADAFVQRSPQLLASLAIAQLMTGDQAAGLKTLDGVTASALKPQSQLLVGVTLAKAELPDRAIPYLESAHLANPAAGDISYDLALCYMALKRYPDAINLLQSGVAGGHETAEIDDVLAEALEANHQTQPAVDALRRSIALNPQDEDSYIEFASLCMDHQDYANAEKVLSVALSARPKSARLLFERGLLNAMQDHFEAAEKDFQASADLAPADNSAYIGLGVTFLETGHTARAVPLVRERLKQHPDDANLSYLLGEALMRTGAQQGDAANAEAQAALERAVRLDPKLVEAHISLGTLYLQQGRLQEAVSQLERARALDPNANSAYWHLAIAYRRLGEADKSKRVLQELKELGDRQRTGSRQPLDANAAAANGAASGRSPQ